MEAVILCGGRGTRAYPHTAELPKPLLDVGGRPMLWHVMSVFASQGLTRFVLAAGFRSDLISEFAADLPWDVEVRDTGEETNTGERVRRVAAGRTEDFLVTYGDGLADIDIAALLAFHAAHDGLATVTTVPLPSPYGTVGADADGRVREFQEKPRLEDHWINGGFMVMRPEAMATPGDDLEREVLPGLARDGRLFAYRHRGFWRSMDTYKDSIELSSLCKGTPPWIRSPAPAS